MGGWEASVRGVRITERALDEVTGEHSSSPKVYRIDSDTFGQVSESSFARNSS